jgi:hypothetical protein
MPYRNLSVRNSSVLLSSLLATVAVLVPAPSLHAQSLATASRSAEFSAFTGVSYIKPDYGSKDQLGFFLGGDYTRFYRLVSPSLEVRASISPVGSTVGERIYSGGLKLSHPLRRFSPYGDFLIGAGTLRYDTPLFLTGGGRLSSDNGMVYTFGGGVDIPVTRHFSAKVDAQYNSWSLGTDATLTPFQVNVGFVWHTY